MSAENSEIVLNPGETSSFLENTEDSILQSLNPLLSKQFSKLTVDDLKDRCKKYGISGFSKLKKNELIDTILKKSTSDSGKLYNLKIDELKALCKQNNLSGYSTLKKEEIISYISLNNILNQSVKTPDSIKNIVNTDSSPQDMLEKIKREKLELDLKEKEIYDKIEKEIEKERLEKERLDKELEKERLEKELEKERLDKELEKERLDKVLNSDIEESKILESFPLGKSFKISKKKIPKSVKTHIWNLYIGPQINEHRCMCCKKTLIKITDFDTGHVISEADGGSLEISNLRPICSVCNHSMGTMNMIDFVKKYGYYI